MPGLRPMMLNLFSSNMYTIDLRRLRTDKRLKQEDIAELLGVDQTRISKIERGKQNLTEIQIVRLGEAYGDLEAYYADEMINDGPVVYGRDDLILYVPQAAEAGFLSGEVTPITNDDLKSYRGIPTFDKAGYAFTVQGNSMEATIRSGEIIITSRDPVMEISKLRHEFIYVVEHNDAIVVKRLKAYDLLEGTITLTSDNEDEGRHPPMTIHFDSIRRIWKGRRIISFNLKKRKIYE